MSRTALPPDTKLLAVKPAIERQHNHPFTNTSISQSWSSNLRTHYHVRCQKCMRRSWPLAYSVTGGLLDATLSRVSKAPQIALGTNGPLFAVHSTPPHGRAVTFLQPLSSGSPCLHSVPVIDSTNGRSMRDRFHSRVPRQHVSWVQDMKL